MFAGPLRRFVSQLRQKRRTLSMSTPYPIPYPSLSYIHTLDVKAQTVNTVYRKCGGSTLRRRIRRSSAPQKTLKKSRCLSRHASSIRILTDSDMDELSELEQLSTTSSDQYSP